MSRLTRDGTAEPVSRDQIFRHARGQGNIIFHVQLTTSRIGNLTRLIHTLLYVMTIRTYTYIHLAHIKSYRPRQSAPAPDFHKLKGLFLGKTLPTPALEESETVPPHIGIYQVADAVGHRRRQGRHSSHNYIYCLRLKGFRQKLTSNTELTRSHNVKNLSQHIALNIKLRKSRLLLVISGSILLRKTAISPVAIPRRKTVVPSEANPLFASALVIRGSILLRKTVIPPVAMPHRKTVIPR